MLRVFIQSDCLACDRVSRRGLFDKLPMFVALLAMTCNLAGTCARADEPVAKPAPSSDGALAAAKEVRQNGIDQALKRLAELTEVQQTLRNKRTLDERELIQQCGLSPDNVRPLELSLERDRFMLQIGLEPKRTHVKLLTGKIDEVRKQTERQAKADRVIEGLQKIVAAKSEMLKNIQIESERGVVSRAEFRKAEAELAEAEVRVALRKEEIAKSTGDNELERMYRELRDLSTEVTLDEVHLQVLDRKLKLLEEQLPEVDRYNALSDQLLANGRDIEQLKTLLLRASLMPLDAHSDGKP